MNPAQAVRPSAERTGSVSGIERVERPMVVRVPGTRSASVSLPFVGIRHPRSGSALSSVGQAVRASEGVGSGLLAKGPARGGPRPQQLNNRGPLTELKGEWS